MLIAKFEVINYESLMRLDIFCKVKDLFCVSNHFINDT